jgi:tetratricopeptide (TPR) repeat protein
MMSTAAWAQQQGGRLRLEKAVQAAQSAYTAGHPDQAAATLEAVLPQRSADSESQKIGLEHLGPEYFPLEELLGLSYASMSQDTKALAYLEAAVRVRPKAEEAHTNLAASLMRLGQNAPALEQFRKALLLAPRDYTANHNLGEYWIQQNKIATGAPYLQAAQRIRPTAYDNGYDLAMADMLTGQYAKAQLVVQALEKVRNTGELHNLEGQIDEKDGKFVAAANEFEVAAHMDPSEQNLFDWGSELLLHRTYEPAVDVFRAAAQRHPESARIMIGLGMSLYARGLYEEAVKALLAAADLSPSDPRCYLFLSHAYDSSPTQADEVIERFHRYADAEPSNALAQYYYAMSIWKGKRAEGVIVDLARVETLLKASIALNNAFPNAHLQLGNLYADQHQYANSVPEYLRALELDPRLADAHYRLAVDYTHLGNKPQAETELALYQKLRSEHMAEIDQERADVKLFLYSSKQDAPSKP